MSQSSTVPVTVSEEAAARITELGMQREFEGLLEEMKRRMPDLLSVTVTLEYIDWAWGDHPRIIIETHRPEPQGEGDPVMTEWDQWFVRNVPVRISLEFLVTSFYEVANGRPSLS